MTWCFWHNCSPMACGGPHCRDCGHLETGEPCIDFRPRSDHKPEGER